MSIRQRILGILILTTIVFGVWSARSIRFESNSDSYNLIDSETKREMQEFESHFDPGMSTSILILERRQGWKTYTDFLELKKASDWWSERDTSFQVTSLATLPFPVKGFFRVQTKPFVPLNSKRSFTKWSKNLEHYPDVVSKFLSEDRRYALLFISRGNIKQHFRAEFKHFLENDTVASTKVLSVDYDSIRSALESHSKSDALWLTGICLLIVLSCFLVMTGSFKGLLFISIFLGFNLALTALFVRSMDIPFSINMIAVPCVLVILSFTDLMHLLYHQHTLKNSCESDSQLRHVLAKELGVPMFLTSLTNVVGFVLFIFLARSEVLYEVSLVSIVGVGIAFLSSRFLALRFMRGDSVYFRQTIGMRWNREHHRIIHQLSQHKNSLLVGVALSTIVLFIFVLDNTSINSSEQALEAQSLAQSEAVKVLQNHFYGSKNGEITLTFSEPSDLWNASTMDLLSDWEQALDSILQPVVINSPTVIAKRYHRFLRRGHPGAFSFPETYDSVLFKQSSSLGGGDIVSSNGKHARIRFGFHESSLQTSLAKYTSLFNYIQTHPLPNGIHAKLSGTSIENDRATLLFSKNVLIGIGISLLFGAIVLYFFTRSIQILIVTAVVNTLPILFALLMMNASGHDLNPMSLFFFTILMGLCVDDSIYLVTSSRKKHQVQLYPIAITSLVLASGFMALAFSSFAWIRPFAWIFLVGIVSAFMLDAFVLSVYGKRK